MSARRTLACLVLAALPLGAQNINLPDFSNITNVVLNGTAIQNGINLRLTNAAVSQLGTAYWNVPVPVALGFDTNFTFQVTNPGGLAPGAADGMVFIIHNDVRGSGAMGTNGGQLAYGGANAIVNSLVIEIVDTWVGGGPCPDLGTNEISVHTGGTGPNGANETLSIGSVQPAVQMADGNPHIMRILYVPGTIDIFVDNLSVPVLTVPYDFATGGTHLCGAGPSGGLSLLGGSDAWVGFGAATGGAWQEHDLLTWQFTSTGLPACYDGTVGLGAGGPFNVLQVNGNSGGFTRRVTLQAFSPISFAMNGIPGSAFPAPFIVFGRTGFPAPGGGFNTPFGQLCFPPAVLPGPGLFVLADSFPLGLGPLLPATPTPWSLTLNGGLPVPLTFSLQGVMLEAPGTFSVTNTIEVDVQPLPPPVIGALTPLSATVGTIVSITGTGFHTGLTLAVDGVAVVPTSVTATQVDFSYPAGVVCDATLTLTNPDGQTVSTALNPSPNIVTIVPGTGPAGGGGLMILVGSGFSQGSTITVAGTPVASITSVSATSMNAIAPPGSVGPATVVVTTPGGCSATGTYTYQ